jgi:hypothetical protein
MVGERFVSRRAVRFGDRGGRGVRVHLCSEVGGVMVWSCAGAVGWFLMLTVLIVLGGGGTAWGKGSRGGEREPGLHDPLGS